MLADYEEEGKNRYGRLTWTTYSFSFNKFTISGPGINGRYNFY